MAGSGGRAEGVESCTEEESQWFARVPSESHLSVAVAWMSACVTTLPRVGLAADLLAVRERDLRGVALALWRRSWAKAMLSLILLSCLRADGRSGDSPRSLGGMASGALLEDGVFLKEAKEEGGLIPCSTTLKLFVLMSLMWLLAVERTSRRFCGDGDLGDATLAEERERFFVLIGGDLTFFATTVGVFFCDFFWLGGDFAVGVFFGVLVVGVFLVGGVLAEVEGVFFLLAGDFASGVLAGVFFLLGGDFAVGVLGVGVFFLLAGVLEGLCTVSLSAVLLAFFWDFLALFGGGGAGGVAVVEDAIFFSPVFPVFFGVVAEVAFFLAGEAGDFGERLREAADCFLSDFFLGEGSSFLATGDLIWTEDLLFSAVVFFFWLRVRDFPRTNWDSLFERDVALLFGGEGVAFAGDKARFLAGVFLRDDSRGGVRGDAVLL